MSAAPVLVGRDAERDRLHRFLADVEQGAPAALVIRGDPGIGKSRLLDKAVVDAATIGSAGFRVIRVDGHEAESEIPYAALSLLLGASRRPRRAAPPSGAWRPPQPGQRRAGDRLGWRWRRRPARPTRRRAPVLLAVDDPRCWTCRRWRR